MRTPLLLLALLVAGCGDPAAGPAGAGSSETSNDTSNRSANGSANAASTESAHAFATEFTPQGPELAPKNRIEHPDIKESSGLVTLGGAWWTHNDSGDRPRVFRSERLDFAKPEVLEVPNALALDWEELAVWGDDLLVCDVGDNFRARPVVVVYRLKVVRTGEGTRLEQGAVYPISYDDGVHDCEGVFIADGKLHLISKDRGEGTHVYRCDELTGLADLPKGERNIASKIATLDLGDREQVTAADYNAATGEVVLLTYTQIARYPLAKLSGKPAHRTWIAAKQCEALCVNGTDLVFTNEQRDVYVINEYANTLGASLLPPRGRTHLGAEWSDVPLTGTVEGEELSWRLVGDALEIRATIIAARNNPDIDRKPGKLGTGLVIAFGTEPKPYVTSEETLVFVGEGDTGLMGVYFLAFDGKKAVLAPIETARFQGAGQNGHNHYEFQLPIGKAPGALFDARGRIQFNALGVGRGHGKPLLFSGLDLFAMYRPYLWGEVLIDR